MSARVENNLRSGNGRRTFLVLAGAGFAAIAVAGVVAFPAQGIHDVREQIDSASTSVERTNVERRRMEEFREHAGFERVLDGHRVLDTLLPEPSDEIDVHGTVRVLAGAAGLQLRSINVTPWVPDSHFPVLDDGVLSCEVLLDGTGSPQSLADLVWSLRDLGHPAAVLEFELSERPERGGTSVRATLGLYAALPAEALAPEPDPSLEQGMPQ